MLVKLTYVLFLIKTCLPSWAVVVHSFNPSIWEAEAGGSLWVPGQLGVQSEFQALTLLPRDIMSWKTKNQIPSQNKYSNEKQNHKNQPTKKPKKKYAFQMVCILKELDIFSRNILILFKNYFFIFEIVLCNHISPSSSPFKVPHKPFLVLFQIPLFFSLIVFTYIYVYP